MPDITLYHAPGARSQRVKMLLTLMKMSYREQIVDTSRGEHKTAAYLKINPFGLVPGMTVNGVPIVESAAQMILLADLDPQQRFAPDVQSDLRAAYLSWMIMVPTTLEPLVVPLVNGNDTPETRSAALRAVQIQTDLFKGPFCLGAKLTALDVLMHWNMRHVDRLGLLTTFPVWRDYIDRLHVHMDWANLEQAA